MWACNTMRSPARKSRANDVFSYGNTARTQAFFKGPMILRLWDTHPFKNKYRGFKVEKFHILILEFFQTFGSRKGFHLSTRHTHLHIVWHPWIHRTRSAPEQGRILGSWRIFKHSQLCWMSCCFTFYRLVKDDLLYMMVSMKIGENRYMMWVNHSDVYLGGGFKYFFFRPYMGNWLIHFD